jgi:hypothetical protein
MIQPIFYESSCNNPSGVMIVLSGDCGPPTLGFYNGWSLPVILLLTVPLKGSNPRKNRGLEVECPVRKDNQHTERIIV